MSRTITNYLSAFVQPGLGYSFITGNLRETNYIAHFLGSDTPETA